MTLSYLGFLFASHIPDLEKSAVKKRQQEHITQQQKMQSLAPLAKGPEKGRLARQ